MMKNTTSNSNCLRFYLALAVCLGLLVSDLAMAQEFQIYGLRALGMGGAGVAATRDSSAIYWNPAIQGFFKKDDKEEKNTEYSSSGGIFSIQLGVEQVEAFGDLVSVIEDLDIEGLKEDPEEFLFPGGVPDFAQAVEYKEVVDVLTEFLLKKPGVRVSLASGLVANFRNFGLGVISLGEIGASVIADTTNIGIYDTNAERIAAVTTLSNLPGSGSAAGFFTTAERAQLVTEVQNTNPTLWSTFGNASNYVNAADNSFSTIPGTSKEDAKEAVKLLAQGVSAESFKENTSAAVGQGAAIGEIPFSYGYAFNDYISVGGSLKLIYAYIYSTKLFVSDVEEDGYIEEVLDNTETAFNFGIDLGVYGRWQDLRAGLLVRNLNAPSFDFPDPKWEVTSPALKTDFRLNPQVRLGLAYLLLDNLILAADFDLTANKTFFGELPGVDHSVQNMSFGLEYTPLKPISLRIGCYRNMKSDDIPIVLTGGLGLNLWAFHLDLGASASTERDKFDNTEWPTSANVGLSFSLQF